MQLTYKHIVLALFIIAIIYLITLGSNVEGLENENPEQIVDKITFNADKFLQNLTEDDAKQMLVSNQLMPWEIKSTRLNSSHITISYAVFCLKKKKKTNNKIKKKKKKRIKKKKTK